MNRRPPRSTLSSSSAASDVYKRQVNGDMKIASKLGTCDFSFDEAKVLHDIWVDLINITESMGCKIFDVVSLMYVGHLAVAMNALQQAVSYFENAATIADASSSDNNNNAQKYGTSNNRPSSSTSNGNNINNANPSSPNQLLSPVNAKTFTLDDPIVRGYIYSFLAELLWQRASFGAAERAARRAVKNFEALLGYAVSYTHLRAHETPEHLVCRLLLEKKKKCTLSNPIANRQ
eukprot:TRINITY_DN28369_c0_g1_i3.p1 TRINITY_DN28369_c0_g1~~TRINITY_DN28369_c0_g1_i3.p1  ORF type:complete len:233 (+),score=66.41 TRINITY_DN28369_c0_g1_i3:50-748(+)